MPVKFQYVPTSGPLSGQSFEDQTEAAFNELGAVIDTIDLKAGTATDAAENAVATANNALLTAEGAVTDAQKARATASSAQSTATDAAATSTAAMSRADASYDTATVASSRADEAVDAADAAVTTSQNAMQAAQEAVQTADAAQVTADAALVVASQVPVPTGVICLWSGLVTEIPSGWAICNGSNGTPDLRGKFVMGSNTSTNLPGATGGANTHNHTATAANTTADTTIGATTLTIAQMPTHKHSAVFTGGTGTKAGISYTTTNSGANTSVGYILDEGGGGSHTHTATGIAHTHTVTVDTGNNLPPYYVLAYIMKL